MMASSQHLYIDPALQYYSVRDLLIGVHFVEQDVKRALELASTCQHPNAQWLTRIFAGKNVTTRGEAKDVFLQHLLEDACDSRALCFAALLSTPVDEVLLRKSAELGNAFAQAELADRPETSLEDAFALALRSAAQNERNAHYWLAYCLQIGRGCEEDLLKSRKHFLIAATMQEPRAMHYYGKICLANCSVRWLAASTRAASSKACSSPAFASAAARLCCSIK